MAKRECPFCKEKVKEDATVCKYCKSELPPLPRKKWYQTWKGLLLILVILGIFARVFGERSPHQSTNSATSNTSTQNVKKDDDAALVEIDDRVKAFQKKLMSYYPDDEMLEILNKDRVKLTIAEAAYSNPDNEKQKKTLARIKALRPVVETLTREVYAKTIERAVMDKGFGSEIRAEGNNKQVLIYKEALMSRALAYKLANEGNLLKSAKNVGFKKLIFTNGSDRWTYDLTENGG